MGGRGGSAGEAQGFTEQSVLAGIKKDAGKGEWYGLRATSEDVAVGDDLSQSVDWDRSSNDYEGDYTKDEYKLDGSSAVSLGDYSEAIDRTDIASLLEQVDNYPGRHVYLVSGQMMGYGSDPGEVILSSRGGGSGASVVKRLK